MEQWFAQLGEPEDIPSDFQRRASRLRGLPMPPGAHDPRAVAGLSMSEVLALFAKRILDDPVLEAAAFRIYSENWIVRQMSSALYELI